MAELDQLVTEPELKAHASAPRVTPEDIRNQIAYVAFSDGYDIIVDAAHRLTDGEGNPLHKVQFSSTGIGHSLNSFTFCLIVLKSGFIVTGQSAPVDPTNFSSEIGQRLAYQDAFNKLWPVFGFALKQKLFDESKS